jgi:predicted deacetylase
MKQARSSTPSVHKMSIRSPTDGSVTAGRSGSSFHRECRGFCGSGPQRFDLESIDGIRYSPARVDGGTQHEPEGTESSVFRFRDSRVEMTVPFQQFDVSRSFCVMLHDVAPIYASHVATFTQSLAPLVGNQMSAAVVPCWGGVPLGEQDRPFLDRVQAEYANILLHGFEHFRPGKGGLVSKISDGKDEMNGLDPAETDRRLAAGQEILARWLGHPACGFIAPTYKIGFATPDRLAKFGIHYTVGYGKVETSSGHRLPIGTWVWDVSPIRLLCRLGYRLGEIQYRFRRNALPCVVLHPLDLERGFLPQIERTVQKLLRAGRQPVLLESLGYGAKPLPAAS